MQGWGGDGEGRGGEGRGGEGRGGERRGGIRHLLSSPTSGLAACPGQLMASRA